MFVMPSAAFAKHIFCKKTTALELLLITLFHFLVIHYFVGSADDFTLFARSEAGTVIPVSLLNYFNLEDIYAEIISKHWNGFTNFIFKCAMACKHEAQVVGEN